MRIAQVVSIEESVPPKFQNGLEFVVSWITEELVKRGHEVTLFASADSKTKATLVSLFPKSRANETPETHPQLIQPYLSLWNSTLVASRASEFDIIHTHSRSIALNMPFVKIPVVQTFHNPIYSGLGRGSSSKMYRKFMKFITDQYSKIHFVTVSKSQQKFFLKHRKDYCKKYTNIYNGIPVDTFDFNDSPKEYLFFIGYINKNKGADVAVKVAKKLGMKLILAGPNSGEEKFFKEKIKPFLNKKIQYIGPVNFKEKNKLYKNALVTLAPIAWEEPFGLTIIESQACGTPVIAFNKGAAPELIKQGKTGFVVENEKEMIRAIKNIGAVQRKSCREWVQSKFSVSRMVDDYEKLYQNVTRK